MADPVCRSQAINCKVSTQKTFTLDVTGGDGPLTFEVTSYNTTTISSSPAPSINNATKECTFTSTATPGLLWLEYRVSDDGGANWVTLNANFTGGENYTENKYTLSIAASTTENLAADVSGFNEIEITGAGDSSVLDMNTFRILANSSFYGRCKIKDCKLIDGGSATNFTVDFQATGDARLEIENCLVENCGRIFRQCSNWTSMRVYNNRFRSSKVVVGSANDSAEDYVFHSFLTSNNPDQVFSENSTDKGGFTANASANIVMTGNVGVGQRCYFLFQSTTAIHVSKCLILPEYDNLWSQVEGISAPTTNASLLVHDSVFRGGNWPIRGADSEYRHNVFLECDGHNWISNLRTGLLLHHNIFAFTRFTTQAPPQGLEVSSATASGIEVYHNTFVGSDCSLTGTITNATNATPIVVTTSAPHHLTIGRKITISGVNGNTAANGTRWVVPVTSTTFQLYSNSNHDAAVAGNGDYTSGGTFTGLDVFDGPLVSIAQGGRVAVFDDNIIYDVRTPNTAASHGAFIRPEIGTTISGSPPRPASDANRISSTADYNAWHNPSANVLDKFGVGISGKSYGDDGFGLHDINANPNFVDATRKWPTNTTPADLLAKTFNGSAYSTNEQMVDAVLAYFRTAYTPTNESYRNAASDGFDIGALEMTEPPQSSFVFYVENTETCCA